MTSRCAYKFTCLLMTYLNISVSERTQGVHITSNTECGVETVGDTLQLFPSGM